MCASTARSPPTESSSPPAPLPPLLARLLIRQQPAIFKSHLSSPRVPPGSYAPSRRMLATFPQRPASHSIIPSEKHHNPSPDLNSQDRKCKHHQQAPHHPPPIPSPVISVLSRQLSIGCHRLRKRRKVDFGIRFVVVVERQSVQRQRRRSQHRSRSSSSIWCRGWGVKKRRGAGIWWIEERRWFGVEAIVGEGSGFRIEWRRGGLWDTAGSDEICYRLRPRVADKGAFFGS